MRRRASVAFNHLSADAGSAGRRRRLCQCRPGLFLLVGLPRRLGKPSGAELYCVPAFFLELTTNKEELPWRRFNLQ
jgi:hypothetical protein